MYARYARLLHSRPHTFNALNGSVLGALGDCAAQALESAHTLPPPAAACSRPAAGGGAGERWQCAARVCGAAALGAFFTAGAR